VTERLARVCEEVLLPFQDTEKARNNFFLLSENFSLLSENLKRKNEY
jgi:hypothetical protein